VKRLESLKESMVMVRVLDILKFHIHQACNMLAPLFLNDDKIAWHQLNKYKTNVAACVLGKIKQSTLRRKKKWESLHETKK
jgi:hypothetical protein